MSSTDTHAKSFFENVDHSAFDGDDKKKIESGQAVPCRTCEEVFGRETITFRYCMHCKMAFCEGVHGSYSRVGKAIGVCVTCLMQNAVATRPNAASGS